MPAARKPRIDIVPDGATLHEAALTYLARFAATEASLLRVLQRRIQRWANETANAPHDADLLAARKQAAFAAAQEVVERLAKAGAVSDAEFALARARRLNREGRSRQVIAAHLAARGINREIAGAALVGDEMAAALVFARRRKLGPYSMQDDSTDQIARRRALGVLASAGFSRSIASAVLGMTREAADDTIGNSRG